MEAKKAGLLSIARAVWSFLKVLWRGRRGSKSEAGSRSSAARFLEMTDEGVAETREEALKRAVAEASADDDQRQHDVSELTHETQLEETCGPISSAADHQAIMQLKELNETRQQHDDLSTSKGQAAELAPCKIHVEVFVASRLLEKRTSSFTRRQLIEEIERLFGDRRPGVSSYVRSSRCIANSRFASRYAFNYLWELPDGNLRCFNPQTDEPATGRLHHHVQPPIADVPEAYQDLILPIPDLPPADTSPLDATEDHDSSERKPETLAGWERHLRALRPNATMVFQLGLNEDETSAIGLLIRDSVRERGVQRTLDRLIKCSPLAFVAYTVFRGVYGYQQNNFWGAICADVEMPYVGANTSDWGFRCVNVCNELGFEVDTSVSTYVDQLLFQGGIPVSGLPRFFREMILPSVTLPEWTALEPAELITVWLGSSTRYFVGKPVVRFLERGGEIAHQYIQDWRDYAQWRAGGARSTLSPRVAPECLLSEYDRWHDSTLADESLSAGSSPEQRLHAPSVIYAPWRGVVYLALPEQHARPGHGARPSWLIAVDGEVHREVVRCSRSGDMVRTDSTEVEIPGPFKRLHVCLRTGRTSVREWLIESSGGETGVYCFEPATGRLVPDTKEIGGPTWWLLTAPQAKVTAWPEDAHYDRERLPSPSDGWGGWQGREVDVQDVSYVEVEYEGRATRLVPVPDSSEPRLIGGCRMGLRPCVYVGRAPRLWLPALPDTQLTGRGYAMLELASVGLAQPERHVVMTQRQLSALATDHGNALEIALDREELLGSKAFGEYNLIVTDRAGRVTRKRICIVPHLRLNAPENLILPDDHSGDIMVTLETDRGTRVIPSAPSKLLAVETEGCRGIHKILVPESATLMRSRLERPAASGTVSLPLTISIPRLRWRATILPGVASRWGSRCLATSLDELDASDIPMLYVDIPGLRDGAQVAAVVVGVDDTLMQELDLAPSPRTTRVYRCDLRPVRDTLRNVPALRASLRILIHDRSGNTAADVEVLKLTEHPVYEQLDIGRSDDGESLRLTASWAPNLPLRWRQLRLHPVSRPWHPSLQLEIPDDAIGSVESAIDGEDVVDGVYGVELVSEDPWLPSEPRKPPPGAPHVARQELGNVPERYRRLWSRATQATVTFEQLAECLFLAKHMGAADAVQTLLACCHKRSQTAPLDVLLAIVSEFGQEPSAREMARQLYTAERIREAIESYRVGEWTTAQMETYISIRPSLRTLDTEALIALLEIEHSAVCTTAARLLVEKDVEKGFDAVASGVTSEQLSVEDALSIYSSNPRSSVKYLCGKLQDPTLADILERLQAEHPTDIHLIRVGYWVRCCLGWGVIDRIVTSSGQSIEVTTLDNLQDDCALELTVRPDHDALRALLLPVENVAQLCGRHSWLGACAKCVHFVSPDQNLIGRHNHAAHGGMGKQLRVLQDPRVAQAEALSFSVDNPPDILD